MRGGGYAFGSGGLSMGMTAPTPVDQRAAGMAGSDCRCGFGVSSEIVGPAQFWARVPAFVFAPSREIRDRHEGAGAWHRAQRCR